MDIDDEPELDEYFDVEPAPLQQPSQQRLEVKTPRKVQPPPVESSDSEPAPPPKKKGGASKQVPLTSVWGYKTSDEEPAPPSKKKERAPRKVQPPPVEEISDSEPARTKSAGLSESVRYVLLTVRSVS